MSLLWTSQELLDAMGGRALGELPAGITGISIDSRTVKKGEGFFAIRGENFDGHDFISPAQLAGAALFVVAEGKLPALGKLTAPFIVVDDVLVALGRLAIASRARSKAKIIAVTGSAGKTTTKEALRHCLAPSGKVHASAASFNNHWGVPLTMARMPQDTDFGVFEVGMNHPGEIRELIKFVRPDIAVITVIAAAHLGFFKNLDEIADAKAEIFEGIVPGGCAVLNRDDPRYRILERAAKAAGVDRIYGFGENARSHFKLVKCKLQAEDSFITARIDRQELAAKINVPGRHIVQNALAVLGVAHLAGADLAKAALALGTMSAEKGRGARHVLPVRGGSFVLIDESYNANPASMRAAIALLATQDVTDGGRRIAVLGDMLELGRHSQKLHRELLEPLQVAGIDRVFLAGPEMKALYDRLPVEISGEYRQSVQELAGEIASQVKPGDVVMVKSSNGIGFSKLVEQLVKEFKTVENADTTA
jgi:UDP-N-acetylmuramoyl-tripeptide--D-alanyl-D-alanine ligase